ncbi:MAG: TRAP transporter small permease [Chloroflexota bacterium]
MQRLWQAVLQLDENLGALALAIMTIVVAASFVLRYAFGQPLFWSNELAGILFIWTIFLGAGPGLRTGGHLGVDILVNLLPPRPRFYLSLAVDVLMMAVLVALCYTGWDLTQGSIKMTIALEAPYWIINVAVPVGSALMIVHLLVRLVEKVRAGTEVQPSECDKQTVTTVEGGLNG